MNQVTDILERFRRGAEVVAVATTGAAGAQLDFQPAPGKWSMRQILVHLTDAELIAATRFRRVIAEDNPRLIAYDQDAWAARLRYENRRFSDTLEMFRRLRADNFRILQEQDEETFGRTGTHEESGVMSLLDLVRMYIEHTEKHAAQMQELRRLYKEQRKQESA